MSKGLVWSGPVQPRKSLIILLVVAVSILPLLLPAEARAKCTIERVWLSHTVNWAEVYSPAQPLPARQYMVWVNATCTEPVEGVLIVEVHRVDPATNAMLVDENMALGVQRISGNRITGAILWWPHQAGKYLLRVYLWSGLPGQAGKWGSYGHYNQTLTVYNGTGNPALDYCVASLGRLVETTRKECAQGLDGVKEEIGDIQKEHATIESGIAETQKTSLAALAAASTAAILAAASLLATIKKKK